MRAEFAATTAEIMRTNKDVALLLGDIGVHSMKHAFKTERAFNVGVREQAMVNVASGLAADGFYPICHTIEPFLCERALEQIKLMAYNRFAGAFVTCGGSYDYASLGCTHHCPAGPANMLTIPGMMVCTPSTSYEAKCALEQAVNERRLAYIRLIDGPEGVPDQPMRARHPQGLNVNGLPVLVTTGTLSRIVPSDLSYSWWIHLDRLDPWYIAKAFSGLLSQTFVQDRFLVIEEFYSGTVTDLIAKVMYPRPVLIQSLGVPRQFLTDYGSKDDMEKALGFTPQNVTKMMEALSHA